MESSPLAPDAPRGREGLSQTRREKQTWGLSGGGGVQALARLPCNGYGNTPRRDQHSRRPGAVLAPGAHLQRPPQLCSWGAAPQSPGLLSLGLSALTVTPKSDAQPPPNTHALSQSLPRPTTNRLEKPTCCRLRH